MGNSSIDFFQLILISFYCESMLTGKEKKQPTNKPKQTNTPNKQQQKNPTT